MSDTPNQTPQSTFDEKLDKILIEYGEDRDTENFNFWQEKTITKDQFYRKTYELEEKAKAAITSLVLEEKVAELESIYHKHGRTYKQTVTDGEGNVYVEDSHRYISNYQMQERIATLRSQQRSIITKEKDND